MKTKVTLALLAITLAGATSAQVKPEDAIKWRQSGYGFMAWNMARIKANVEGSYNKDEVIKAANVIQMVANSGMGALYLSGTRIIPLSPYLAQLLATLPRINDFVFAGKSASRHIEEPRSNFTKVKQHAGVTKLTIHGLRRSFSLLGESAGAPAGAIAQIMGHSPDSTAEGYRPRSVDALRPYLVQIEAHILQLAGVSFDAKAAPGALRVVSG